MTRPLASDNRLRDWFRRATMWDDAILPDYDGGANVNIVASVLRAFDIDPFKLKHQVLPPLREEILDPAWLDGARVIVLVVLDGVGTLLLQTAMNDGIVPSLDSSDVSASITSVFPSTTAAALTSLQMGVAPGRHGLAGYTLYLPEVDEVVNMITWKPAAANGRRTIQIPPNMVPSPHMYRTLEEHGVNTVLVSHREFKKSALTQLQASGVKYSGHRGLSEFAGLLLRQVRRPGRRFIFGYWDGVDALGHAHGPDSLMVQTALELIDRALERGFLSQIADLDDNVAVIITADHGITGIPKNARINLHEIEGFSANLPRRPTGEPRLVGLPMIGSDVISRIREHIAGRGVVFTVREAIEAGLYGPGDAHPELAARVGETLLAARDDGAFDFPGLNNQSIGGHGSLTADEMLVPLLVWRIGK